MLNLIEWQEFFDKAEEVRAKPYICQVNQSEDMIGWGMFFDNKTKNIMCTEGKPIAWLSLDDLISATFEHYGMYFDVHVYYAGEFVVDVPEHLGVEIGYGVMAKDPDSKYLNK